MRVRTIASSRIYSGGIALRKDKFLLDGRTVEKEVVEHQNSVGIVAVSGSDVILVAQYRRAAGRALLEIPAGKIEKGETPRQAAIREMAEEIGCSGRLEPLAKWYLAPGYSTELMYVFVATGLRKIERGPLDDDAARDPRRTGAGAGLVEHEDVGARAQLARLELLRQVVGRREPVDPGTDEFAHKGAARIDYRFLGDAGWDLIAAYDPQISVRITERKSRQPATVNGAVRQPARIQMQRKVRLNELMAASGGFTERAAGTIQILHTEPLMCPEPGEEQEAAPIDATKVPLQIVKILDLKAGKPEANPIIRPGDYVHVTEAEPVYITGSVYSPQGVYMRDQLTLGRALAMVGGIRKEAKADDIRIYRQKPGSTDQEVIRVDYSAIKKNQKPDVLLQAFDVVDVPEAGMFSKGRFASTLVGAVSGGLQNVFSSAGMALPTRVIY